VALQTGDVAGDIVSGVVSNEGVLQGRGDASEGNTIGDGLRLFSNEEDAAFAGAVVNEGLIAGSEASDVAAGVRIDGGLELLGTILNEGEIRGTVNAIDASEAASVTIVNDGEGVINGNVLLSDGNDTFVDLGTTNGAIFSGAGDDVIVGGDGDDATSTTTSTPATSLAAKFAGSSKLSATPARGLAASSSWQPRWTRPKSPTTPPTAKPQAPPR